MAPQKGPGQFDDVGFRVLRLFITTMLSKRVVSMRVFQALQVWLVVEGFLGETHPACVLHGTDG